MERLRDAAHACPCPGRCATCESIHDSVARVMRLEWWKEELACRYAPRSPSWRKHVRAAVLAAEAHGLGSHDGHFYQAGVFSGNSMRHVDTMLRPVKMWGLDSFQGLPDVQDTVVKRWVAGWLRSDPRKRMRAAFGERIGFVGGFYNESLPPISTPQSVHELGMRQAMYVDIDCDYYESTAQVLHWLFATGLAGPGTVIGYDDWWVGHCERPALDPLEFGEGRGHAEVTQKYGVVFECVAGACRDPSLHSWPAAGAHIAASQQHYCSAFTTTGPVFVVRAVGMHAASSHGFAYPHTARCNLYNASIPRPPEAPFEQIMVDCTTAFRHFGCG